MWFGFSAERRMMGAGASGERGHYALVREQMWGRKLACRNSERWLCEEQECRC